MLRQMAVSTVIVGCLWMSVPSAQAQQYVAFMDGGQEVPPVETDGTGVAVFLFLGLTPGDPLVVISLWASSGLTGPVQAAHLHQAQSGESGPVVLDFGEPGITYDSQSSFGAIVLRINTSENLTGPLEGGTLGDLLDEIGGENIYINLHTEEYPDGEIRGQLEPVVTIQ